jgi:serine/threonine protein kinase
VLTATVTDVGDDLVGQTLDDRYLILERLGAGGMGAVYRAEQLSVGRPVAIKVIDPRKVGDPQAIMRFVREARLASRLSHPNAVAILDFDQTRDGVIYLVMELLVGPTLDQLLRRSGRLSPERVIRIGMQICDALLGAHHLGIVHRDLKPSNVILLEPELVKVVDFGLARTMELEDLTITEIGTMVGTPIYMAPEIMLTQPFDQRADLYSLGVVLYQLAADRLPFTAHSWPDLIRQVLTQDPISPVAFGVPTPLARVLIGLLARSSHDRYSDAAHAKLALREAADLLPRRA